MGLAADFPSEERIPGEEHEGALGGAGRRAGPAEAVREQHGGKRGEQHVELESNDRGAEALDPADRPRHERGERSVDHRRVQPSRVDEAPTRIALGEIGGTRAVRVLPELRKPGVR